MFRLFSRKQAPKNYMHKIVQQLEEIIIRLQTSINSLKIGFIIVDINEEIVNINDGARSMFCSEFGKPLSIQAHHVCTIPEIAEKIKFVVDLRQQINECLHSRTAIFSKDIQIGERYLYLRLYPILLGGAKEASKNVLTGVSIIVEDVTQEKAALRSRDEFLSIASHELRTPLTAIRGNATLIKEYYGNFLEDKKDLQEMVDDIEVSSEHLIKIVNDFLNVSRLEQGKLVFNHELFNLFDVIEDILSEVKFAAQKKTLTVNLENMLTPADKLFCVADEVRTREVIYNLVGNAIKYTDKGKIRINVTVNTDTVIIKIIDTGRGIPIQNQALLFKKFQQAGKSIYTTDSSSGTGLGLYISKLMAERMGGILYLEKSEENVGSVFVFTLPMASALEIKMLQSNQEKKEKEHMVESGV
jgi:signal transduction histidine kinase